MATPVEVHADQSRRDNLRELRYAGIATLITLVLGSGLYLATPKVREEMAARDTALHHARQFNFANGSGEIIYSVTAEGGQAQQERYRQDLELLQRRFERGQFAMATLPGMENSAEYKAMTLQASALRYSVETRPGQVVLAIRAQNGAAQAAVQAYLKFLETRWQFR
ncbi:MAG: hypothetical protein K1X75_02175 [Leptospirales bacterium]|nr:hypothetical protein [Leptospirales bacterium]